jgi:hypothetical protein
MNKCELRACPINRHHENNEGECRRDECVGGALRATLNLVYCSPHVATVCLKRQENIVVMEVTTPTGTSLPDIRFQLQSESDAVHYLNSATLELGNHAFMLKE